MCECVCSCEYIFMCLSVYVGKYYVCDMCDYIMWVCVHMCDCKCEYMIVCMLVYVFLTVFLFLLPVYLGS